MEPVTLHAPSNSLSTYLHWSPTSALDGPRRCIQSGFVNLSHICGPCFDLLQDSVVTNPAISLVSPPIITHVEL